MSSTTATEAWTAVRTITRLGWGSSGDAGSSASWDSTAGSGPCGARFPCARPSGRCDRWWPWATCPRPCWYEDIAGMTLERAKAIYLRDFWGPAGCDAVPDALKFDLFDYAVNSGPKAAAKALQRIVGAHPDGIIGPRTLLAISSRNPQALAARLLGARLQMMTDLPTWPSFGKGWARRIADNLQRI